MKLNAILFYVFWIVLSIVVLPFSLVYRVVHRLTDYTFKGVLVDYTKPFGKKAVEWFCRTFNTPIETLPMAWAMGFAYTITTDPKVVLENATRDSIHLAKLMGVTVDQMFVEELLEHETRHCHQWLMTSGISSIGYGLFTRVGIDMEAEAVMAQLKYYTDRMTGENAVYCQPLAVIMVNGLADAIRHGHTRSRDLKKWSVANIVIVTHERCIYHAEKLGLPVDVINAIRENKAKMAAKFTEEQ